MSYTYSACVLLAAGFGLLTGIISRNHKPAFSFVLISNTTKTGLTNDAQYENTLWIKFVPVTGTDVLFSVWDTQEALARKIGTTRSAVCRYERQPTNLTLSTLEKVARAMGRKLVVKLA